MKFLKKKDLQRGEAILFSPQQHWIILTWPIAVILGILFLSLAEVCFNLSDYLPFEIEVKYTLLAGLFLTVLYFLAQCIRFLRTAYCITNKRLITKKGAFFIRVTDMPIERIESLHCAQGFWGRLLNYGTVAFAGIGGSIPKFGTVCKPALVRRIIGEIIEKNRLITIVQEGPPKTSGVRPKYVRESEEPLCSYGTFVRMIAPSKKED
ncbi:MAG: PH domain-containing protein [Spirochaetales bacterium]|nr:PH domain-containing protein [Spirochaetales bacterium]